MVTTDRRRPPVRPRGRSTGRGDRRRPVGGGSCARRHLWSAADGLAAGQPAGRSGGRTGDGLGDDGRSGRRAGAGAAGHGHPPADTGPAGLDRGCRPAGCCSSARRSGGAVVGGDRRGLLVVVGRPPPAALESDRAGGRRVRSARAGRRGLGGAGARPHAPDRRGALAIGERLGAGRTRRAPSGPAPGRAAPSAGPRARPHRRRGTSERRHAAGAAGPVRSGAAPRRRRRGAPPARRAHGLVGAGRFAVGSRAGRRASPGSRRGPERASGTVARCTWRSGPTATT